MAIEPQPPQATRALSGIQPTGRFHWGNYFGAIRQYIELQPAAVGQRSGSAADEADTMASPSVVRRSMPRAVASTSLSMLLNAIAKPIDTDTLAPAPANDAASAAAPAIASMLERSSACKVAWPATIVMGSAWLLSAKAMTLLEMRFSA